MIDLIEKNNKDNLRRMKAWLKKSYIEDWKYPEQFEQDMNIIILAAAELKKEIKKPRKTK